jgi:hypothetical protein
LIRASVYFLLKNLRFSSKKYTLALINTPFSRSEKQCVSNCAFIYFAFPKILRGV